MMLSFRRREGGLTRAIESQTTKVPSGAFLALAGVSIMGSIVAMFTGRKQIANFIGQWVPTVLLLGVYNKVAKEVS